MKFPYFFLKLCTLHQVSLNSAWTVTYINLCFESLIFSMLFLLYEFEAIFTFYENNSGNISAVFYYLMTCIFIEPDLCKIKGPLHRKCLLKEMSQMSQWIMQFLSQWLSAGKQFGKGQWALTRDPFRSVIYRLYELLIHCSNGCQYHFVSRIKTSKWIIIFLFLSCDS